MIKYYIKTYFKQIKKNKTTYFITIGGFSISLAIAILFSSYVLEELSVDKGLSKIENIYKVVDSKNNASIEMTDRSFYYEIPGIENIARYCPRNESSVRYNKANVNANVLVCDPEFFDILSISFIKGKKENIFKTKYHIVITKGFSERLFGEGDPIGKQIVFDSDKFLTIAAVVEDFPKHSSFNADLFYYSEEGLSHFSAGYNGATLEYSRFLVELSPLADRVEIEKSFNSIWRSKRIKYSYDVDYKLSPFKDSYFSEVKINDGLKHSNIDLIYLIGGVTILILILSALNYINLLISVNLSRNKEFGIKKTTGANKSEIFGQILLESFFNISLSIIIGLLLFNLFDILFEPLLERSVSFAILFSSFNFAAAFIIALVALIITVGLYPAYLASKSRTIFLLNFRSSSKDGTFIKNIISTVQFSLTAVLIVSLIVVSQQSEKLKTKDLGYNTELLLKLDVNYAVSEKADIIKDKLLTHSNIESISNTAAIPGAINSTFSRNDYETSALSVDKDFLETFKIELVAGRFFRENEEDVCVVTEKTLRENNISKWEGNRDPGREIIGVIKDIKHQKLYAESKSLTIMPANKKYISYINIRITPNNIPATLKYIKDTWEEVLPNEQFVYSFYDDWIDSFYKKEERQADIIKIFTFIAIFIALMGLYGMTELSVAKKIKEFGIRKVFGAGTFDIFVLQNKGTIKWNLLAIVVSIPVSYYFLSKWLEGYVHRIEISWEVYLICAVLILALSVITTSYRVITSTKNNPIDSLRNE